jgi:NADH dehydrogenase
MERVHPRVVIVGAGFGGLQCARKLDGEAVDVVLIDPRNYHLFTPLLYQVASCLLSPTEIAAPLRKVFRGSRNVRVRMSAVMGVDFDARTVQLADGDVIEYDYLVLSAGSRTNFFGNDEVEKHALGLKDLGEALQLRNHVLDCLERASATNDAEARRRLLTFCIVGGGPTGVEYAGALAELVRLVLPLEYPELKASDVHIVLLEGGDRLLPAFKPRMSGYAHKSLEGLGVDVRLHSLVAGVDDKVVRMKDGREIETESMIWSAGVRPVEIHAEGDATETRAHRLKVDDFLRIEGRDRVYAVGDAGAARDKHGKELPMTSPPAMQAGRYVAKHILGRTKRPFRYFDKGSLATIGRRSAVAEIGPARFTGFIGWIVWLVVHLYYLIGFENRLTVLLRWSWYYVRYDRPIRSIIRAHPPRTEGAYPT